MLTGVDRSCHTQASEYKLLPHLFAQGVLCRVRYLTIEWHLGWLKERQQDWLSGMALRLGLDKMLTDAVRLPRRRDHHRGQPLGYVQPWGHLPLAQLSP